MIRLVSILLSILLSISLSLHAQNVSAGVVESGDLNVIEGTTLGFFDLAATIGTTEAAAVALFSGTYADARVATPLEFESLVLAAGVTYDGALTAADGWTTGTTSIISSGSNYGGGALRDILAGSVPGSLRFWTDPDGIRGPLTTRDSVILTQSELRISQFRRMPSHPSRGWLVVTQSATLPVSGNASVPEASQLYTLILFSALYGAVRMKRKRASVSR